MAYKDAPLPLLDSGEIHSIGCQALAILTGIPFKAKVELYSTLALNEVAWTI